MIKPWEGIKEIITIAIINCHNNTNPLVPTIHAGNIGLKLRLMLLPLESYTINHIFAVNYTFLVECSFHQLGWSDEKFFALKTGYNFSKRVDNKFLTIFILSVVMEKNVMWLKKCQENWNISTQERICWSVAFSRLSLVTAH